jgi:hypothetical protein
MIDENLRPLTLWDGRLVYGRTLDGLPAFRYGWGPRGLATRRQLRAMNLSPGGQEKYAVLYWALAEGSPGCTGSTSPARSESPAPHSSRAWATHWQPAGCAISAAKTPGYCVPTSEGRCWDCIGRDDQDNQGKVAAA